MEQPAEKVLSGLTIVAFEHGEQHCELNNPLEGANYQTAPLPEKDRDFQACEYLVKKLKADVAAIHFGPELDYNALISSIKSECEIEPLIIALLDEKDSTTALEVYGDYDIDHVIFGPFTQNKMVTHIQKAYTQKQAKKKLEKKYQSASKTAKSAMAAAHEMGLVMQLMDWLQPCCCYQDVANALFKLAASLELDIIVQIYDEFDTYVFPSEATDETLRNILTSALTSDIRIISKKRLMLARMDYLIVMVTNSPWEDNERCGRLRDILVQAAAIAEAKVRTIMVNGLILAQHDNVMSIMELMRKLSADTQKNTRDIMTHLSQELEVSALTLDLTEEQENKLLALSHQACDSLENLYQSNDAIESHFFELMSSLTKVSELTREQIQPKDNKNNDDESELF